MARLTGRTAALAAAACLAVTGCHSDKKASELLPGVTSVVPTEQNPCSLTTPNEVGLIFHDSARSRVAGRGCQYVLGNTGSVRLTVRSKDKTDVSTIMGGSQPVTGLGATASWAAVAAGQGGVLAVRADPTTLALFEVQLQADESKSRVLAQEWAKKVLPRMRRNKIANYAIPGAAQPDPCTLLSASSKDKLIGAGIQPTAHDANTCSYQTSAGIGVVIGPLSEPTSGIDLLSVGHIVEVKGKSTEWPLTPVEEVGDAAIILRDPTSQGNLELYALSGGRMIKVAVTGTDADGAEEAAKAIANAVLDHN